MAREGYELSSASPNVQEITGTLCRFGLQERAEKRRKQLRPTHYIICVDAPGTRVVELLASLSNSAGLRLSAIRADVSFVALAGILPLCSTAQRPSDLYE